ncbi:MAG: hypothetical protein WAW85_05655 [Gordonia sp. (in: high G+C Gram-positive bacteria)]|uniref:hypothetical protein n=1 Tax=Gordonia sp. (in: high G+C Gram-positive bacteria) TaxID=84139 RepID=UPI003BB5234A
MSAPGQRQSPFSIVMRGYDRDQVTDHIRQLEADLAMMAADRDSAHAHADELLGHLDSSRTRMAAMQADIDALSVPPSTVAGMSERLSRMLSLATEEAADIRATAHDEASELVSVARQDADAALADAHSAAASTSELAQQQADKIISEAEAKVRAAEEAAADAEQEAAQIVADAQERAKTVVAAAEEDASGLRGAAHHVATARLARSRDLAQAANGAHTQILDHLEALREHLTALPGALKLSDDERALIVTTHTDDADLLNRTLVGRDRFNPADFRPGMETTDVLEALDVEYADDDFLDDLDTERPAGPTRASA